MVEQLARAERIIDSDLLAPRTARAIILALQQAGEMRVRPKHFVSAAQEHRAKVRVVAAGCGWLRCLHCGEWRDVGEEPSVDLAVCPCCLEVEDDEVLAALSMYVCCGGGVSASVALPASVNERAARLGKDS